MSADRLVTVVVVVVDVVVIVGVVIVGRWWFSGSQSGISKSIMNF